MRQRVAGVRGGFEDSDRAGRAPAGERERVAEAAHGHDVHGGEEVGRAHEPDQRGRRAVVRVEVLEPVEQVGVGGRAVAGGERQRLDAGAAGRVVQGRGRPGRVDDEADRGPAADQRDQSTEGLPWVPVTATQVLGWTP